jgi:hypothetical protein
MVLKDLAPNDGYREPRQARPGQKAVVRHIKLAFRKQTLVHFGTLGRVFNSQTTKCEHRQLFCECACNLPKRTCVYLNLSSGVPGAGLS